MNHLVLEHPFHLKRDDSSEIYVRALAATPPSTPSSVANTNLLTTCWVLNGVDFSPGDSHRTGTSCFLSFV